MFTDVVGSTALYDRLGSQRAFELVRTQEAILFPVTHQFGGTIIKTIGDAIMAVFRLPDSAVECAMEMQRALEAERQVQGKEYPFREAGLIALQRPAQSDFPQKRSERTIFGRP